MDTIETYHWEVTRKIKDTVSESEPGAAVVQAFAGNRLTKTMVEAKTAGEAVKLAMDAFAEVDGTDGLLIGKAGFSVKRT